MILHKLTKLGNSQWTHPDTDYLIEIEFNMDVFFEEEIYQEKPLFSAKFCLKKVICLKMKYIQFPKRAFWDTPFRCEG